MFFSLLGLFASSCLLYSLDGSSIKQENEYRQYADTSEQVKEFYYQNHTQQTVDFVKEKRNIYLSLSHDKMGIWEAMQLLDDIIDESDPDLHLNQTVHAFQTAEAIRKDGHPRWLILVGLIHDLGKLLTVYEEPQWAVVGDTFPVGCKYSDKIVFSKYFAENPDYFVSDYQSEYGISEYGIYSPHCGFDSSLMSWGHDEYLYQVVKEYLPKEASYIIRYHSFYPWHKEGAYAYFASEYDQEILSWLQLFSKYDLYSKVDEPVDVTSLKPFYKELVQEFFPKKLQW